MGNALNKQYGAIVYCSIFSIMVLQFTSTIITPGLGAITTGLPAVSVELIQMIQSIQGLVTIPAALLAGILDRYITKRQILFIAIACIIIGGVAPGMGGGIYFILLSRAIFGFGYGLVFPMAFAVIDGLFEGKQRDDMVGYANAAGAFSGILLQFAGGGLAAISWRSIFWGYLIAIPFALLIIWKLPEPPKKPALLTAEGVEKTGFMVGLTRKTWGLSLLNIVNWTLLFTFMTTIAIVVEADKIATASKAGYALMLFVFCAFLSGIVYGKIRLAIKSFTLAIALGLMGFGLLICLNSASMTEFYIASVIFGFGFGLYTPEINVLIMNSAAPAASTAANSLFVASTGIGQFISPIVISALIGFFSMNGVRSGWFIAGAALVTVCIISAITQFPKVKVRQNRIKYH